MTFLSILKKNQANELILFQSIHLVNTLNKENFKRRWLYYNTSEIISMLIPVKLIQQNKGKEASAMWKNGWKQSMQSCLDLVIKLCKSISQIEQK